VSAWHRSVPLAPFLVDGSSESLENARRKVRRVAGPLGAADQFLKIDLTRPGPPIHPVDGAVIVNTLFTMEESARPRVLRNIFEVLEPGGRVALNEPVLTGSDRPRLLRFVRAVATDAVKNGAPMTELDRAWIAEYNLNVVDRGFPNRAQTADDLGRAVRSAGFEIVSESPSYYGMNLFMVLARLEKG